MTSLSSDTKVCPTGNAQSQPQSFKKPPGSLIAWRTYDNPCPGQRYIGGCPSTDGQQLARLPQWPWVCGRGWDTVPPINSVSSLT